jgi:hypothetical protein
MKQIFILSLSLSISLKMIAQDTTTVYIDNKKAAEVIVKPDQSKIVLLVKKSKYKKYKPFIITVSGEHIGNDLYKRSLEIAGKNSSIIEETKNKRGHFDISKTETAKLLLTGKPVSLYLLLNPANPLMMMPSRRLFLGDVVMK